MATHNHHIGLFGGSFDPPHLGHVALVQAGLDVGMDEIWVIPALPVHRTLSGYSDGAMRLAWLKAIFAHEERVKVLDWEVKQSKPTPSIDSLRQFHKGGARITPWLMLGTDAWRGLTSWQAYPEHQKLCNALVFNRQGEQNNAPQAHSGWQNITTKNWLNCTEPGHYYNATVTLPEISATFIRKQMQLGLSLTGLVPKVVQSAIELQYRNQ